MLSLWLTLFPIATVSQRASGCWTKLVDSECATVCHPNIFRPSAAVPAPVETYSTSFLLVTPIWENSLEPTRCMSLTSAGGRRRGGQVATSTTIEAIPAYPQRPVAFHCSTKDMPFCAITTCQQLVSTNLALCRSCYNLNVEKRFLMSHIALSTKHSYPCRRHTLRNGMPWFTSSSLKVIRKGRGKQKSKPQQDSKMQNLEIQTALYHCSSSSLFHLLLQNL